MKSGGNRYDPDKVKAYVARIEEIKNDLETQKSRFANIAKDLREDIKSVIEEAHDNAGIPKRELKDVIKTRELERRMAAIRDGLDESGQEDFDMLRQALGDLADTPLGEAAQTSFRSELAETVAKGDAATKPKRQKADGLGDIADAPGTYKVN